MKIMFLSEETYRKNKVRDQTDILYYTGTGVFFPPQKKFSDVLIPMAEKKGIKPFFGHVLQSIDKTNQVATFKNPNGDLIDVKFDLLHFVPPQTAPEFIRKSELAHTSGWVDVNRNTLQHVKYSNVFAMGDCANLPTGKTSAAIFSQTPVLIQNLLKEMGVKKA